MQKSSTSSFLTIIYDCPDLVLSIHIVVYLPTAGRDSEFVEELAKLDACIQGIYENHPGATIFLRGDFNVNPNNHSRAYLLDYFISNLGLQSVNIQHPTYHHFLGNGIYDSNLDRIFYTSEGGCSEKLSLVLCKLDNPLLDSHHDMLISTVYMSTKQAPCVEGSLRNITAPRTANKRTQDLVFSVKL